MTYQPSLPNQLEGIRLKLTRAHEHLTVLQNEVQAFRDREPYRVSCNREANGTELVYTVHVVENPPAVWSLVIGDCLQNMRSALDHLVWQLAIRGLAERNEDREPSPSTAFPISPNSAVYFERNRRTGEPTGRSGLIRVADMPSGAQALIQSLQPYHSGDDIGRHPLRVLNELARFDRHRVLTLVGAVHHGLTLGAEDPIPGVDFRDETNFGPFEDGAIISRFIFPYITPLDIVVNPNFAFFPAFGNGGPAAGFLVLDVLEGILDHVANFIVSQFIRFF